MSVVEVRAEFRRLHESGCFVMPNAPDAGSARLLEAVGAAAIATTSSGFAATLGRRDMSVTRDELVDHVRALAAAVTVPVSVDAERCFADDPSGAGRIDAFEDSVARVAAAADAAHAHGMVLTARCEHHIRGIDDFDATRRRLEAYRDAGADALFAPGLRDLESAAAVVAIGPPVNVLVLPGAPTVGELAAVGVRRISVGGMLTWTMYGALVATARHLLERGTLDDSLPLVDREMMTSAFA